MKLFQYEMKKIYVYRWGLFLFAAFLLMQTGMLLAGDMPDNLEAQQYRESYQYYLEQVDGEWTQEKEDFLKAEAEAIQDAEQATDAAWQSYYKGALTGAELQSEIASYDALLERKNGFNVVYNQYLYICEEKENRFFLETNGWSGLLNNTMLDFPLILATLLMIVPVFCNEYTSKMDLLSLTTRNGQKSFLLDKIFAVGLTIIVLCLSEAILRYGFYALRYGLPHGDYPLQSVEVFGACTKNVTLMQAYILLSASRLFGGLYLAALILAVSAISRQYSLSVFIPTASVLLPWVGLSEQVQYQVPLPLPFLLGVGFLKGNEYTTDTVDSEQVLTFQEISSEAFMKLLWMCVLILCVCLLVIWWKHHTTLSRHRISRKPMTAVLLLVIVLLSGCSSDGFISEEICYNSSSNSDVYTENYHIYYDEETGQPMVEFMDTGECVSLCRDPLLPTQETEIGSCYFLDCNTVYYTTITIDSSREYTLGSGTTNTIFAVRKVDLTTFQEKIVFEHQSQNEVLGITLGDGSSSDVFLFNSDFFVGEDSLYVLLNDKLYCISLTTGAETLLDISFSRSIAFDGRYLYYTDDRYILCCMDTSTGNVSEWTDVAAYDFCLADGAIYYVNLKDQKYLYKINKDGTDQQLVLEQSLLSVTWDGNTVNFTETGKSESTLSLNQE
ncbi:MAG: DUF5050 domain-containing protein [Clostridiales bacterium]|nr:DUF5050 domain-containing protein [Clostridiales bacterium]